jgi:integrative and conjugative element protein (TIGR02256 family)
VIEYWSSNKKFGLVVSHEQLLQISAHCIKADGRETGGVLIGNYSANNTCASITQILGPTQDSKSGRTWFIRGISGLQKLIDRYWERDRHYYLGEWHFHPNALPDPSGQDIAQMRSIATSQAFNCPEPLLIIMGGNPAKHPLVRVFVFPKGQLIELISPQR